MKILSICFGVLASLTILISCENGGSGFDPESQIIGTEVAYQSWPNDSTSNPESSQITSKVLVSNLDAQGDFENIFLSVLPNSSNQKSSILRVTSSSDFTELASFKSTQVFFLKDSTPFTFDLNNNNQREIVIVSYDLKKVYALEFKNNDLTEFFIRWKANLPYALDVDFERQLQLVSHQGREVIKVGNFGIYEKNNKAKVVDLSQQDDDDDDDDDDD